MLVVLRGQGDGTFSSATSVMAVDSPQAVTTGDWNCDGKLDVAVAGMAAQGNLRVFTNNGR